MDEELQGLLITLPDGRRMYAVCRYIGDTLETGTITLSEPFTFAPDASVYEVLNYVEECAEDVEDEVMH